jgi:hypothetical protein
MKKRLIISESQYAKLKTLLNEAEYHELMVEKIAKDLDSNYDRAFETYRDGNEYKKRKVFQVKVDGEAVTPQNLLEYLKLKYEDVSEDFLKQLMNDWCDNKIKDGRLSKNVSIN